MHFIEGPNPKGLRLLTAILSLVVLYALRETGAAAGAAAPRPFDKPRAANPGRQGLKTGPMLTGRTPPAVGDL